MKTVEIRPLFNKTHLSSFLTILISMLFCPGDLAPQTRSRKLLERPREDSMHIWLGFKNREEMEKAMREKKKAQQQHQQQRNSRRGSVVVMNEITENYGTVLRVCLDNS